jgi:hypothetical protein
MGGGIGFTTSSPSHPPMSSRIVKVAAAANGHRVRDPLDQVRPAPFRAMGPGTTGGQRVEADCVNISASC